MVATTNRPLLHSKVLGLRLTAVVVALLEAVAVFFLAQHTAVWTLVLALVVIVAVELWTVRPGRVTADSRSARIMERVPALLVGMSVAVIIAVSPRLATQVVTVVLFALWRMWWSGERMSAPAGLVNLLVVQAVMFEAIFLMAAIWRPSNWIVLMLVWLGSYLSVYAVLQRRGERAAGVMAATWAVVAVEISWVLLLWLFTYTMSGGYILIPQPALILTALGYCFGSIYTSQREGSLSRSRLTEYLVIGLILVAIVIVGTPWRGSL